MPKRGVQTENVKQYVNLDPAAPGELNGLEAQRAGRKIKVVATVKTKGGAPRQGARVVFELKSLEGNVDRALDKANFSVLEEYVWYRRGLPTSIKRIAVTDAEGKAEQEFTLSAFGGDEFKVEAHLLKAGDAEGKKLASSKYTVWRRFYCQTSAFGAGAAHASRGGAALPAVQPFDMAAVVDEFAARKHNIELVEDNLAPAQITRRCEVLVQDQSRYYQRSAREGYDPRREPLSMRMVLVNQIADSATAEITFPGVFQENVARTVSVPHKLWVDESLPLRGDWLVSASWCWSEWDLTWKDLPLQHLDAVGPKRVQVTLPAMGARKFAAGRDIRVKITYRYLSGNTCGVSWYNAVWIASAFMAGQTAAPTAAKAAEKRSTTIHEAGHFIGMVPATQPTHYTEHGHQGPHCTTGLSPGDVAQPSYSGLAGTCVMFGEDSAAQQPRFCGECDRSVRTRPVRIVTMPSDW